MSKAKKKTAKRSKKKELTPAQKGWRTQRKRYTEEEISDRQREAAHKAWETIRANERREKRAKAKAKAKRASKKG